MGEIVHDDHRGWMHRIWRQYTAVVAIGAFVVACGIAWLVVYAFDPTAYDALHLLLGLGYDGLLVFIWVVLMRINRFAHPAGGQESTRRATLRVLAVLFVVTLMLGGNDVIDYWGYHEPLYADDLLIQAAALVVVGGLYLWMVIGIGRSKLPKSDATDNPSEQ